MCKKRAVEVFILKRFIVGRSGPLLVISILIIAAVSLILIFRPFSNNARSEVGNKTSVRTEEDNKATGKLAENGNIGKVSVNGDTLKIEAGSDILEVQVCRDNILKVHYLPDGESSPNTPVIGNTVWSASGIKIDTESDPILIKTDKMTVKINKKPYGMSLYDTDGNLLLSEKELTGKWKEMRGNLLGGLYPKGVKFSYRQGDNFYGINGYSAFQDSYKKILRNVGGTVSAGTQGNCGAPFIWTTGGYGLLVDSDGGEFFIDDTGLEFSNGSRKDTEYYVIAGKPAEIMQAVADISGKSPMFPKWSMGFSNSEWGIDEKELLSIVNTYRSKGIPIDNYTLDFDWKSWGKDNYGEWVWNNDKFPDGLSGKLKNILDSKGIKLSGIMKPRIHMDTIQGKYATEQGFWWNKEAPRDDYFSKKKVNDLNFALPECRQWFWDNTKQAFDTGIIGFWNDEADEGNDNLQFLYMQKALYDGQRSYTNKRVWSINRNFYLGAQKYAYAVWSGDIPSGFFAMKWQRERMLSAVNLGEAKWGMDTGGFQNDPSSENYARWMQFSAFVPVFRVHGSENRQRQPWVFGKQAEQVAADAIKLRYKLIPYIYSYERRAYETGIGLVKPLIFDYPEDANVANYVDAWMFGDYMLAAPVVDEGQTLKDIYLPKGEWIDYFKGTVYSGGQTIKYTVDDKTLKDIPLFIKKGAIIPSQQVMNYIGEKPVKNIDIDVFPDVVKTDFRYYDDDGETYNYENGDYFAQNMTAQDMGNDGIAFTIGDKEGSYTPPLEYYTVKIHKKAAGNVTSGGKPLTLRTGVDALENSEGEGWATGKDAYGEVTYVRLAAGVSQNIVLK